MLVCFRATRHSSELPANAIMASDVRATTRTFDISFLQAVAAGHTKWSGRGHFSIPVSLVPEISRAVQFSDSHIQDKKQ